MGLFGKPKIDGDELKQCITYYEASTKIIAFQTREADIYNNAMVKYGNSITQNQDAANEAVIAAHRLVEAANKVINWHQEIKNVPVAASNSHHAWFVTLYANVAWASGTASAIESLAKGLNPNTAYVQQLVNEYQQAWKRAQDEDKKFLKRLNVTREVLAVIVARATRDES